MERRSGWKHWFADVGYIYVLVAALVGAIIVLTDFQGGQMQWQVRQARHPGTVLRSNPHNPTQNP
jgi:hypothetical protein